jgi:3-deoxy-7-phosphoheptulonate synthase
MINNWTVDSWKNFEILQQPKYPDIDVLNASLSKLSKLPGLVFSGETRMLKGELLNFNNSNKFILQIGDCSESFDNCSGPNIHNFLRLMLQVSSIIEYQTDQEVIKIGRIAGQYAKPRSSDFEKVMGVDIPVYRGDNVNNFEPTLESRIPDPKRLIDGYFYSAATLNLMRAFLSGGYSEISNFSDWEKHFFSEDVSKMEDYIQLSSALSSSIKPDNRSSGIIYTSHEALILQYEQAFARLDTTTRGYYCTSAHTIWIGERTRQLDSAHIEFASGLENPIGVKVGPDFNELEVLSVIRKLNPDNISGKIMLITRMGKSLIEERLHLLQLAIKKNNLDVIWICDAMHGNTFSHQGLKFRSFDDIVSEINSFFKITRNNKLKPGGVHLEVTGNFVSECIGGLCGLKLSNLPDNYTTKVDPRLNAAQTLELAFIINSIINENNG